MEKIGKYNEGIRIQKEGEVYADKADFIRKWRDLGNVVTVIIQPEKAEKIWMLDTLEDFFGLQYADKRESFKELKIWEDEEFLSLQGTYPVIRISFAGIGGKNYLSIVCQINQVLTKLYDNYEFLMGEPEMNEKGRKFFQSVSEEMNETTATFSIYQLSRYLFYHYRKKSIVLLDEYDVPLQKAVENGCGKEMAFFMKTLINASFKTNPYLERAILTGTKEVGKDSVLSDLNNLSIMTADGKEYKEYADCIK